MQVDLERRSNLQRAHGGFDLGEPSLMLGQLSFVLALRELALEPPSALCNRTIRRTASQR
jgi:hypothetical protein